MYTRIGERRFVQHQREQHNIETNKKDTVGKFKNKIKHSEKKKKKPESENKGEKDEE